VVHFKVLNQPKTGMTNSHKNTDCMLSRYYPKGLWVSYVKTYTDVSHFVQDSA